MATPINIENVQTVKEEAVTAKDMRKQLEEFLKRKHVKEGLSKDKHARLKGLMVSLKDGHLPCTETKS